MMFHRRAKVVPTRNQNLTGREAIWSGGLGSHFGDPFIACLYDLKANTSTLFRSATSQSTDVL